MNTFKFKKSTKAGKTIKPVHQVKISGSPSSLGLFPGSGDGLSAFYSSGPVLSLVDSINLDKKEDGRILQRKQSPESIPGVTSNIESRMASMSSGQLLSKTVRSYFEQRMRGDFSQVRVHTDTQAAETANSLNAKAFTAGENIVFAAGQYSPGTPTGKRLLAHELVHVEQQKKHMHFTPIIQRTPDCKNEDKVDKIKSDNPRGYDKTVTMRMYEITKGDTYGKLARKIRPENKVATVTELSEELQKLNKGIRASKIGNCVVLIKGWVSPGWIARTRRVDCTERIEEFQKDKDLKKYSWKDTNVKKGESSYEAVIKRFAKENPGTSLYTGRLTVYAIFVESVNKSWIGKLNKGECVAMPFNWIDPNIGRLPPRPDVTKPLTGEAAKAVATVYAEQTGTSANAQLQQKYIWYAIRKRIETAVRGPNISSVLSLTKRAKSEFYAIKPTRETNYKAALADLEEKKPKLSGVINARRIVLNNWDSTMPADAGAFYFHWKKGSSSEGWYNWKQYSKHGPLEREKICAWKWAKKKGWVGHVTKEEGWLKRIKGDNLKKPRIGSMYIYP